MGLFDAFFGDGGASSIEAAGAAARGELESGLRKFRRTSEDFLDRSTEILEPDITAGRSALALLGSALGIEGAGAQEAFFNDFQNDPGFQASLGAGIDALDASAAARGTLRSGAQARDLFSFGQRFQSDAFNERLDRLSQLAGRGTAAAGQSSGQTFGTGQNIANAQFGTSQLLANLGIDTANAAATARNVPINNLIGLAGAVSGGARAAAGGGF